MSDLRKAAEQMLECLLYHYNAGNSNTITGVRLKLDEKAIREARAALAAPRPERVLPEAITCGMPFVIKQYTADLRPTIKGNGFDGLEIGISREEAEEFVAWVNARIAAPPAAAPRPEPESKTPAWWMDGLAATLMREGVNKHRAREIAVGYWEAYCQIAAPPAAAPRPEPEPGLEFMENSLSIRLQINRGKRALGVQRFVRIEDIERHPQIVFLEVDNAWKMLKKAQEDKA